MYDDGVNPSDAKKGGEVRRELACCTYVRVRLALLAHARAYSVPLPGCVARCAFDGVPLTPVVWLDVGTEACRPVPQAHPVHPALNLRQASNVFGSRGPRKMKVHVGRVHPDGTRTQFQPTADRDSILACYNRNETANIVTMVNKPPKWNDAVGAYVLNFNGRVTMASVKNFQLVTPEDRTWRVPARSCTTRRNVHTRAHAPRRTALPSLDRLVNCPRWHSAPRCVLYCWFACVRACLGGGWGRRRIRKSFLLLWCVCVRRMPARPSDEAVLLQFGRVGKDLFTMDFQWPLSPLQGA